MLRFMAKAVLINIGPTFKDSETAINVGGGKIEVCLCIKNVFAHVF